MFFDLLSPGVNIDGGYYGTSNRTDTSSPPYGWDILSKYADATNENPPFPSQIASEYNNGPLIKNDFGALTMILQLTEFGFGPALEDSARNGFVINLGDNSSFLNVSNRQYSFFGLVMGGTNFLQYFNGLTNGSGIISGADFVDQGTGPSPGVPGFSTLPEQWNECRRECKSGLYGF